MRFLVDMPLSPGLARWLHSQGHDAVHASELGLSQAPDTEIMERARVEARTVITADLDFPRLLSLSAATEPSLILFRGGNWRDLEVVDRMRSILGLMKPDELEKSILMVDRNRIRRRTLPL